MLPTFYGTRRFITVLTECTTCLYLDTDVPWRTGEEFEAGLCLMCTQGWGFACDGSRGGVEGRASSF
jgi:hypothetical protein